MNIDEQKTNYQFLTLDGKEYAVVPRGDYEALLNAIDEDETHIAAARRVLEDLNEELVPFELAEQIAAGINPVRVWRKYRGMTVSALATESAVTQSYLSDIEDGKKPGSVEALKRIAASLDVFLDDLI